MKKKFTLVLILLMLLTSGCSSGEKSNQESVTESITEIPAQTETSTETKHTEATQKETNSEEILNNKNIHEYDLSLPENAGYLKYKKEFSYRNEYALPDGKKIIEDKNLYLEDLSGNRMPIIEVPEEETEKYVVFWDMIDDNRFCYYIINHETTGGTGVYNLETGDDFRIDVCEDHSGYVPRKVIDNYLWLSRGIISDFKGFGKLNLDTYEFTEIDCSELLNNNVYYLGSSDISPDGTKATVYGVVSKTGDMNEYQVAVYSLTEEKILNTYIFFSENDYINHQLLYYSEDQVYLYTYQYGDDPKYYLYIIDL